MLFLPSPLFPRLHFPLPPTKFRVEERCTSRWKIRPCPAAPLIPEIMARATLDKSGKRGWYTRGSTSRRRRDLAPVIFFLGTDGARVRVPYVCRVYGTRRSWMGYTRGGRGRGGLEGKRRRRRRPRRHPYNEERGRGKKRRLICRPRTSPIRVLFVPPAIFLHYPSSPLLYPLPPGMYTWTVRFSTGGEEEEGIEGMEVSWKKGARIIV